jgi:hypothetical protein
MVAMNEQDFPYLDSLVEEVVQGKRALLFGPGVGVFVATNLMFTLGGALLCAAVLPAALHRLISEPAVAQLVGVLVLVPQIVIAAALVVRGHPRGRAAFMRILELWLAVAAVSVLTAVALSWKTGLFSLVLATALVGTSRVLVSTRGYRVFSTYHQRLYARLRTKNGRR